MDGSGITERSSELFSQLFDSEATFTAMPSGKDVAGGDFRWRGCGGPVWVPELSALAFNDIGRGRTLTWAPGRDPLVLRSSALQTGLARDDKGRFVTCEVAAGRVVRIEVDGSTTVLADSFEGKKFAAPDAVVVGPDGATYFTDPHRPFPPRFALGSDLVDAAGVYRVRPGSSAVEKLPCGEVAIPGGLALSADGQSLFVSDERARRVVAYPLLGDGGIGAARLFEQMPHDGFAAPHGLCLDDDGNVYVGGPKGLWVFAPTGEALGVLPLPSDWINGAAFGGAEGNTLFVVTSTGVGAVQTHARAAQRKIPPATCTSPGQPISYEQRVDRIDIALDAVIAPEARVRTYAHGGFFEDLGGGGTENYGRSLEGTFWDPAQRCLFFSDIANNRRMRLDPASGAITEALKPTGHANGATLDREGRVVQCEQSGRCVSRIEHDGTRTVLIDRYDGKRLNRPNDVVVRSDGSVFFTNPWWTFGDDEPLELDGANVIHLHSDLRTATIIGTDYVICNGLALSEDERILYVNESYGTPGRGRHIRAYDVRDDGSVDSDSSRVWFQFPENPDGSHDGVPDGMKVDQAGNVYCGGPGGLWIFNRSAHHIGTIVHGDRMTNNLCFGGDDWRTLYFVSWVGLHSIDLLTPGVPLLPAR